jgi:hypothetical protein
MVGYSYRIGQYWSGVFVSGVHFQWGRAKNIISIIFIFLENTQAL